MGVVRQALEDEGFISIGNWAFWGYFEEEMGFWEGDGCLEQVMGFVMDFRGARVGIGLMEEIFTGVWFREYSNDIQLQVQRFADSIVILPWFQEINQVVSRTRIFLLFAHNCPSIYTVVIHAHTVDGHRFSSFIQLRGTEFPWFRTWWQENCVSSEFSISMTWFSLSEMIFVFMTTVYAPIFLCH